MKSAVFFILAVTICISVIPIGFISCTSSQRKAEEAARIEAEIQREEEQRQLQAQKAAEQRAAREAEEARRAEERRQREEERQQPRFSPERQEYIKRTLLQAVGESRNQANRGRTLFFESDSLTMRDSTVAGHYLISDWMRDPANYVIMEFYGRIPFVPFVGTIMGGDAYIILYRVEINQAGIARFVIDSFRE